MNTETSKICLELKVVLEEEIQLMDSLLETMHKERELLLLFRPTQLTELNKRKELITMQHRQIEVGRTQLVRELAVAFELNETEPGLSTLADAAGGQIGQEFRELRSKLIAVSDAIAELNKINAQLIEFSIKSVKGSVSFLKKRFFNSQTYGSGGRVTGELGEVTSFSNRA